MAENRQAITAKLIRHDQQNVRFLMGGYCERPSNGSETGSEKTEQAAESVNHWSDIACF